MMTAARLKERGDALWAFERRGGTCRALGLAGRAGAGGAPDGLARAAARAGDAHPGRRRRGTR